MESVIIEDAINFRECAILLIPLRNIETNSVQIGQLKIIIISEQHRWMLCIFCKIVKFLNQQFYYKRQNLVSSQKCTTLRETLEKWQRVWENQCSDEILNTKSFQTNDGLC